MADEALIQKPMEFSGALTGKGTTLPCQAAELPIWHETEFICTDLVEWAAANGIYKDAPAELETGS